MWRTQKKCRTILGVGIVLYSFVLEAEIQNKRAERTDYQTKQEIIAVKVEKERENCFKRNVY